ncbi:winged helix-turn-helix domain-containing protein [Enterobacter asburiae]
MQTFGNKHFGVSVNMTKFILENKVIYDSTTHSLFHVKQKTSQVTLAIPASLCLLALLQNKDETVSLELLLSFAWTSRGINVSNNTIYQNISILRKTLVNVGLSADIVKTVPKRGFVVNSENFSEFISPVLSEDKIANDSINVLTVTSDEKHTCKIQFINKIIHWMAFVIISVICCLLSFFGAQFLANYNSAYNSKYIYPEFQKFHQDASCYFYRNKSTKSNVFFEDFIASHEIKCNARKWVYIFNYPPASATFVLRCTSDILSFKKNDGILCSSDYYF